MVHLSMVPPVRWYRNTMYIATCECRWKDLGPGWLPLGSSSAITKWRQRTEDKRTRKQEYYKKHPIQQQQEHNKSLDNSLYSKSINHSLLSHLTPRRVITEAHNDAIRIWISSKETNVKQERDQTGQSRIINLCKISIVGHATRSSGVILYAVILEQFARMVLFKMYALAVYNDVPLPHTPPEGAGGKADGVHLGLRALQKCPRKVHCKMEARQNSTHPRRSSMLESLRIQ